MCQLVQLCFTKLKDAAEVHALFKVDDIDTAQVFELLSLEVIQVLSSNRTNQV